MGDPVVIDRTVRVSVSPELKPELMDTLQLCDFSKPIQQKSLRPVTGAPNHPDWLQKKGIFAYDGALETEPLVQKTHCANSFMASC
ncbi:MAG: hypothetical protein ACR2NP_13240, partial [Pirellulaceae bacterium]